VSTFVFGSVASTSHAIEPHHEYRRLVESAQNLTSLKSDMFGESASLYNGKTEVSTVDIELPGNSALPVRLRRIFNVELRIESQGTGYDETLGGIGGWSIEVPHITGMFGSAESWPATRCSVEMVPSYNPAFKLTDIWQGNVITTPDGGGRVMLRAESNTPMPEDGISRKWSTAQRDAIDCIPMKSGLPGEGYRVKTTSGDTYYFDTAVQRYAGFISKGRGAAMQRARSSRVRIYVLASRVEDRFGNVVNYEYNGNGHPTRIWANDGRQITLHYNGNQLLSASTNSRIWTYDYGQVEGEQRLSAVNLPDGSRWGLSYSNLMKVSTPLWDGNSTPDCAEQPPAIDANFTLGMSHPSGAQARFEFSNSRHYRSGVHMSECMRRITGGAIHYELGVPNFFDVMTLYKKEITGPGLAQPLAWTYRYLGGRQKLWGGSGSPAIYPCTSCAEEKTVEVTHPDGRLTEYSYGFQYARNEGRLLGTTTRSSDGRVARSETTRYMTNEEASQQPFASRYGVINSGDDPSTAQVRPIVQSTVVQDGVLYHKETARGCAGNYCYDLLAFPTGTRISNSSGYYATNNLGYHHDRAGWVLGQLSSNVNVETGRVIERTSYDQMSLPYEHWSHGLYRWRRTYHQDGAIASITDANQSTTLLNAWKRGVPQQIGFPDGTQMSAAVDDNGWLTSTSDQRGAVTEYAHDQLGRVTRLDYPTGDTVAWSPRLQTFSQSPFEQFGLGAGHWVVSTTQGNAHTRTYLDALWRPVLSHEFDAADPVSTSRFARKSYDAEGRIEFESYPGSSPGLIHGQWNEYDAMGRVVVAAQDTEHGLSTTYNEYLTRGRVRSTNPNGAQTLTTFWLAESPDHELPHSIDHPEGLYTEFVRDFFGNPTAITRRNADRTESLTRRYVYDQHNRLCKRIEPETGTSLIERDAVGNVTATSTGVIVGDPGRCDGDGNEARRVVRRYDTMNRVVELEHLGEQVDQRWVYEKDGKVSSIHSRSQGKEVINRYGYNNRRLLTLEQLQHTNGDTWTVEHGYDANGASAFLRYPSGEVVDYRPNAFGQPTQAGMMAQSVTYHPDGSMLSFVYGNGINSNRHINARRLPQRLLDENGREGLVDDAMTYDRSGNLLSITDGLPNGSSSKSMHYDAFDRLVGAASASFGGDGQIAYSYDAFDNMKSALHPGQRMHYYSYDASNRLTNVRDESGATVVGLTYDVQGNLAIKNGERYLFDIGNRLREVEQKETYHYDGHGRRTESVSTQLGAIRSMYSVDGKLVHQQNEREAKILDYVHLNGRLLASLSAPGVAAAPVLTVPGHTTDGAYPVSWTPMNGATAYELQELPTSGDWLSAYSGPAVSLQVDGKESGHYTYRVRSCNISGCGAWSTTAAIFVSRSPTPPFAITVPALGPAGAYQVTWLPPRPRVPSETQYELEESKASGEWVRVFKGESLAWSASQKPAGVYSYRVRACNPDGCSGYQVGGEVEVFHAPEPTTLSGPEESLNGSFDLYWAAKDGATSYQLDETVNGGQWVRVLETASHSTTLSGRKTATYGYRVSACDRQLCSPPSATHSIASTIPPEYAPASTWLAHHAYQSSAVVHWSEVSTSTHYQVWMQHNGGAYDPWHADGLELARSGLFDGSWSFSVKACNRAGCGPAGSAVSAYVLSPPSAPSITEAHQTMYDRPPTNLTCRVRWTASHGADRYELYSWPSTHLLMYSGPETSVFSRNTGQYCSEWQVVRACNAAGCSHFSEPRQRYLEIIPGGIQP